MPPNRDIYSLLSTISSSFVWDEIQKMVCFLTADRLLSLCAVSFMWSNTVASVCTLASWFTACFFPKHPHRKQAQLWPYPWAEVVLSILVAESRDENSVLVARNVLVILHLVSLAQVLLSMDHVTLEKHTPGNWPYRFENCSVFPCLSSSTWWNRNCSCLYGLSLQCRYYVIYIKMLM